MPEIPLLSVITICKNEPFIETTCQSVMAQTYQDFEWLVIDGASTDNTLDTLSKCQYRINTLVSEPDSGVYNAMNKGIAKAKGKYLLFLNGGDMLYAPDTLKNVMPFLESGKADIFYGDSYRLFEEEEKCFIKTYPEKLVKNFFLDNTLAHQSSFIKREMFARFGLYREDFKIVSDKEKWLCFMENGAKFTHLPFVCSYFRMNGISRLPTELLKQEKIRMLEQYFDKTMLRTSDLPYLKALFDSHHRSLNQTHSSNPSSLRAKARSSDLHNNNNAH